MWYDEGWVLAAIALLAATATASGSIILWIQLGALNRKNEFDILIFVSARMARRFGDIVQDLDPPSQARTQANWVDTFLRLSRVVAVAGLTRTRDSALPTIDQSPYDEFYSLRHKFKDVCPKRDKTLLTLQSHSTRNISCLVERIRIVGALPEETRQRDFVRVREFVNTINDIAEMLEYDVVNNSMFLGRYHLALIREVYIAEPYIYHFNLYQSSGRWGRRVLRVGEMARAFNDINPMHRSAVYFSGDSEYGCIYDSPQSKVFFLRRVVWRLRYRLNWYPEQFNSRAMRRQAKLIQQLQSELGLATDSG